MIPKVISAPQSINDLGKKSKHNFDAWFDAMHSFLKKNATTLDIRGLQAAMVLKVSANMARIHFSIPTFDALHCPTCWDPLYPEFEELVSCASAVIDTEKASLKEQAGDGKIKPLFCLDMSLIGVLFSVAHKCRDPLLRRKVISLLYSVPRQEGVWDSILTARVAERIVVIEEAGLTEVKCAADVPDWARVSDVNVNFDLLARKGSIKYTRGRGRYDLVRDTVEDHIEW